MIAERWQLLGNAAAYVARLKAPEMLLRRSSTVLGIAHPGPSAIRAKAQEGWLAKRQGGAGGSHIVRRDRKARSQGRSTSITRSTSRGARSRPCLSATAIAHACLASASNGRRPRAKPRGAMAARPARPSSRRALEARLTDTSSVQLHAFAIKGLGTADFLVNGGEARAARDQSAAGRHARYFRQRRQSPYLRLHLDAVLTRAGFRRRPRHSRRPGLGHRLCATEPITVPFTMIWPDWTADRPKPGNVSTKTARYALCWPAPSTRARGQAACYETRISTQSWHVCDGEAGGQT